MRARVAILVLLAVGVGRLPAAAADNVAPAGLFEEILFRATFDGSANADVHKGDPSAQAEGPIEFETGRHGRAIAVGERFARLRYTVGSHSHPLNLSCRRGSLSFHFKAVNWDPDERFRHLLFQVTSGALLRVFTEGGELVFETGSDLDQRRSLRASLAGRARDEWMHVVATWSEDEIRLFLDGKLAARDRCEDRFLSHVFNTTFDVGDMPRGMGRPGPRKTLIDDLTIYRRPLEADELGRVEAPASDGVAPEPGPPAVSIPRAGKAPRIDGIFDTGEWPVAAQLTNFASVDDHRPAGVQTTAYVTHDAGGVYFAVVSPVLPGIDLTAKRRKRDDDVWQDDAIQIYLSPPSGDRYLFIGNSAGTIYDRKYHKGLDDDVTWDGSWQFATKVTDGTWTAEVGISFADLGETRPAEGETWRLNVTRDRVEPQNLSAWPVLSTFADTTRHGHLTFTGRGAVVRDAPAWAGVLEDKADLSLVIGAGALDRATPLDVEWIASAAGRTILKKTHRVDVQPGRDARADLHRSLAVAPDAFACTVRDPETDRVIHHQSSSLSPRRPIAVTFSPVPSRGTCTVNVKADRPDLVALSSSARVELIGTGGTDPLATLHIERLAKGRGSAQFDLDALEPGDYAVRTVLESAGNVVATASDRFTKPHEPWRGTTLGLSNVPPPPWTPIEVARTGPGSLTISCWNRRHVFDRAPLPTAIDNGPAELLTAPVRLEARIGGAVQAWTPQELKLVSSDANRVVFTTTQTGAALSLAASTTMEFDGMLWTEMTLTPTGSPMVEALDLVVPIRGRHAKYRHWPGDADLTGSLGRADGWQWAHALPKYAFLWIGDDDLGLTWFFETFGQFERADEARTIELTREEGVLTLRVRYLGKPAALTEPLKIAFGLQATPTRPRPVGWRSWGGGNVVGTNIDVTWTEEHLHRYGTGYPEAANPDFYRRYIANAKRNGWKAVPYNSLLFSANDSPEMQYNVADWDLGGGINKYSDIRRFWWGRRVCGAAASYGEFFTWKANQYLEQSGVDGLYHDLQWSYRCGTLNHGYDEPHRSIRGDRELNKRVYTMLKGLDRPTWKFDHASNFVCSVTSPFSDLFTSGEEMLRYPGEAEYPNHKIKSNYFHNMRLDYFKACGATGRQWGITPCLLTQITSNDAPRYTESLYAILVPHDAIPTWEAYMRNIRYQRRVQGTVEEFGIGAEDVSFLPYWHDTTPVRVSFTPDGGGPIRPFQVEYAVPDEQKLRVEEAIGASVYHRAGRRSLVAVFNYTPDDGTARVVIDVKKLGFVEGVVGATDAFTRRSWVRADRPIELDVKNLNYRMIWVEPVDSRTAFADRFPIHPDELMLAGYRPDRPRAESNGTLVAGDFHGDPRDPARFVGDQPQRLEFAQTFTLKKPARVIRVEVHMKDSDAAFALRRPVRASIVRLGEDGLPTEDVVVAADAFGWTWVDSRTWSYRHLNLRQSRVLEPGPYAIVFTKVAEDPSERFHALFTTVDASKLPGQHVTTRHPDRDSTWKADGKRVICFGVYGFE